MATHHSQPLETGRAPVNGIEMYYEIHGRRDGVPLVLLHGGGSTIEVTFSRGLPVFAGSRRVIAIARPAVSLLLDRDDPTASPEDPEPPAERAPLAPSPSHR